MRRIFPIILFIFLAGCGNDSVFDFDASVPLQTSPYVHRVSPGSGKVGDTITIYGFGFSMVPQMNIVSVGDSSTTGTNYALVSPTAEGEIESLTFTIPATAVAGTAVILVTTFDNPSNANLTFTVTQ